MSKASIEACALLVAVVSIGSLASRREAGLVQVPARRLERNGPTHRLNLNTATPEELESLPGIGPRLAERIVQARTDGRVRAVSDLQEIPGVGERLYRRISPLFLPPLGIESLPEGSEVATPPAQEHP